MGLLTPTKDTFSGEAEAERLIIIPRMDCEETLGTCLSAYHHLYLQYDLQDTWMSPLPIQPKMDDQYKSSKTEYTCVVPGPSSW